MNDNLIQNLICGISAVTIAAVTVGLIYSVKRICRNILKNSGKG